jgi:predicted MPP superfamily phosphohydrolase
MWMHAEETTMNRTWRRVLSVVAAVAIGLAGAWAALSIAGFTHARLGPFDVRFDARFGPGETTLALPPLGELEANTHTAPLSLRATLEGVAIRDLADDLRLAGTHTLIDRVLDQLPSKIRLLAIRAGLIGIAGALIAGLLAFRTRWRLVAVSVGSAFVLLAASETAAYLTYRPEAFRQPTFSGSLALAPQLIGPVQTATDRIDLFREELARVVDGAARVYASIASSPSAGANEITVLHISDIHLSPLGMDFARQLASAFHVDFVLDTGDITSFGTRAEALILAEVPGFHVPYLFVRGNHDSAAIEDELRKVPNAVVLDGQTVVEHGLRVYGLGDPVFTPNKLAGLDDAQLAAKIRAVGPRIAADIAAQPRPPDIVAVHDDRMAEDVAGRTQLVISGHFHVASSRYVNGTLYLRVGSTGGAGANVYVAGHGVPLSAEILHFRPAQNGEPPTLVAWDLVSQSPTTGDITIRRNTVRADAGVPVSPPSPSSSPGESPPSAASVLPSQSFTAR